MIIETISFPTTISACFDFEQFIIDMATANATDWGVDDTKLTKMASVRTVYEKWYKVTVNKQNRCMSATSSRNQAWGILKNDLIDLFNTSLLYNPAISNEDKTSMGIKLTDTTKKSAGRKIISSPLVLFSSEETSILHVVYSDSNNIELHAKPEGIGFLELAAKIDVATAAPDSVAECLLRYHISRSHEPIIFDNADRGKTFFAYTRWVTTNGNSGPWSGLVSGIIP